MRPNFGHSLAAIDHKDQCLRVRLYSPVNILLQNAIAWATTATTTARCTSDKVVWIQTKSPLCVKSVTSAKGIDAQSINLCQIKGGICVANSGG